MNTAIENALSVSNDDLAAAQAAVKASKKAAKQAKTEAVAKAKSDKVEAEAVAVPALKTIKGDLRKMIKAVSDDTVTELRAKIQKEFDDRIAFELANGGTERKQELLTSYAKRLTSDAVVRTLAALEFDVSFVNQQRGNKRFNVYAVDKVADIAQALSGAGIKNKVNNAVMRSLFACRAAGLEFNGLVADAAVSDKVRVADAIKKVLVRHTVSENTVDTQRSSTMSALTLFGLVENIGSRNTPVWRLTDTPATREMEVQIAA